MANITIYEIAKQVGVSASTVSRVINSKPGVNPEVRRRVLQCLDTNHYSPNEAARGLVNKSSKMVGILLTDIRTTHHTVGIYHIQHELEELGYICIIMSTGPKVEDKAKYIRLLNERRVDAAVLIGSTFATQEVGAAISKHMPSTPVFIVNGYIDLPNVYGVIADEKTGISSCVHYLANKGRMNLAFLNDYDSPSNLNKIEGFKEGLERYCPQLHTQLIINVGSDKEDISAEVCSLFKKYPTINGLVCAEDYIAAYAIRALHDIGLSVPGDVSVIGVNNSIISEICFPRISTLDNVQMDLYILTARNVIEILKGNRVVKKIMLFTELVEKESS